MHQQLSAAKSGIQALLQEEAALPANCFYLNGTGKIAEGIEIELSHIVSGGQPVLMVGEYFILRDRDNGCLYQPNGQTGLVRRMNIRLRELDQGRKPLQLLSRPTSSNVPHYLLADPVIELPKGVTSHVRFWTGIKNTARRVARDKAGPQSLFAFDNDGETVDAFYADGRVVRIARTEGKIMTVNLPIEDQADLRIAHALDGVEQAKSLSGDERAKRTDMCFHQVVEVLEIGGKRSEAVFEKAYEALIAAGQKGQLRPGVKNRILGILQKTRPGAALQFSLDCESHMAKPQPPAGSVLTAPIVAKPKGLPAEARAKKAERSARDAAYRAAHKGSSNEQPLHQKGGKGKKH